MSGLIQVFQLYPALNKLVTDLNGMWNGGDAKERILQHKLDDTRERLDELMRVLAKQHVATRDIGTQTDYVITPSIRSPTPVLEIQAPTSAPQDVYVTSNSIIQSDDTSRTWAGVVIADNNRVSQE